MASYLPIAPIVRAMKEAGVERVSKDAAVAMQAEIYDYIKERATYVNKLAVHANRKTVQAKDILAEI